jgi:hypothetical protein
VPVSPATAPPLTFVVLAQDLEVFCFTVGYAMREVPGKILQVSEAPVPELYPNTRLHGAGSHAAHLRRELRDTKYHSMIPQPSINCSHRLLIWFP